jgi:hydrogenase maturation protein HypF
VKRLRIEIAGVVQGVGFRPRVWRIARELGLAGFVRNSSAGVEIEVEGARAAEFSPALAADPPPLARIQRATITEVPAAGDARFVILPSRESGASTEVSPDTATCDDCLRELADPADRRFCHPFITCTNCGPRYSITRGVPYDRPNTTMAPFPLCPDCAREYADPSDRRFHAQPVACPACGPAVTFLRGAETLGGAAAFRAAISLLRGGGTLALKGLGGFHLAVDALAPAAVARLRERKRRSNKAFALMAPDLDTVRRFCALSAAEEGLLLSPEHPVVLLRPRPGAALPAAVAPASAELGFMLPSTPLHWLLFHHPLGDGGAAAPGPHFAALVMTSGNLAEEPIVRDGAEAGRVLAPLADALLDHDRGIFMRVDDSVVRHAAGATRLLRRARGYVPSAIPLPGPGPEVLACGAEVKNTFCLTTRAAAVVSQHIGDLENHETMVFFLETLENLKAVYRVTPAALAHDLHPGYFSTRWALEQQGLETWGVQHHWAHVASVLAERGIEGPVIGVALDGSGHGTDGTVWGGEFLVADLRGFERRACFRPLPMPGGDGAARNPWRMALSVLVEACGPALPDHPAVRALVDRAGEAEADAVLRIRGDRRLSPLTSGAGRLFEAVAALLALCDRNTFEGEAAMRLEAAAGGVEADPYPFALGDGTPAHLDFAPTVRGILGDLSAGAAPGLAAARFHATVAEAAASVVARLHAETGIRDVALSGGVFQNRLLLEGVCRRLAALGLAPHTNSLVPANDGGISLGQAVLLRARLTA